MSDSVESGPVETLEFKWGKKRGRGGKKKEVQFYESFTYDGVDYTLYDTVYLYKEGEPEPYIAKLIKIWEIEDKTMAKKVKVHWFFRPSEIRNWIEEGMVLEKEIFLASGEGACAACVNPLESISGKCSVICTLKDDRNPQPSGQELEKADFIFYRTFDVEHCTISDLRGDRVAGLEVQYVFNRKENKSNSGDISDKKQEGEKFTSVDAIDSGDVAKSSSHRTLLMSKGTSFGKVPEIIRAEKKNVPLIKAKVDDDEKVAIADKLPSTSVADGGEASRDNMSVSKLLKKSSFTDKKLKSGERTDSVDLDREIKGAKSDKPIIKFENKDCSRKLDATSDKDGGKNLDIAGRKRKLNDDSVGPDKGLKQLKTEEKMTKLSDGRLPKVVIDTDHGERSEADKLVVTPRPNIVSKTEEKTTKLSDDKLPKVVRDTVQGERSEADKLVVVPRPSIESHKWFRPPPWEERIKSAYEQGTLIQLSNLELGYTSSEVEDIIWHAFKEHCSAKVVQRTTSLSPHYGHALIIIKTKGVADMIIKKLEDGCLMLPNRRLLVGSRPSSLSFPGKQSTFIGHLSVDNKMKHQMQRDVREAVSTSHCSQPNTIEFEMALEWCLLQSRSDSWWRRLYKQQGEELRKLKGNLKSK